MRRLLPLLFGATMIVGFVGTGTAHATNVSFCHSNGDGTYEQIVDIYIPGADFQTHLNDHPDDIIPAYSFPGYVYEGRGDQSLLTGGCIPPPPPPCVDEREPPCNPPPTVPTTPTTTVPHNPCEDDHSCDEPPLPPPVTDTCDTGCTGGVSELPNTGMDPGVPLAGLALLTTGGIGVWAARRRR